MTSTTAEASPFDGLVIEQDDEGMPQRTVGGRPRVENPFTDAVWQSYAEATQGPNPDPKRATRRIYVPIDPARCTMQESKSKRKDGSEVVSQWQQHPNVTTALYLLRQAAVKHSIGVRIVVDYDASPDGKTHTFAVQKKGSPQAGKVRVRFLGQKKKERKGKDTPAQTAA